MKKNLKRFLSMALAIILVFGLLPAAALAVEIDTVKIEAEAGVISGDATTYLLKNGIADPTSSGEDYAENIHGSNGFTYTIDCPSAGAATLKIYHMQEDLGAGSRSFAVWVNDGPMLTVAANITGGWTGAYVTDEPATVEIELKEGENKIVIGTGSDGTWAPNMDYLVLEMPTADPEVVVLQAEDETVATLGGGAKPSSSNNGVIGWIGDVDEGTVTFNFERGGTGTALMNIYYASGGDRTLAYSVNGGEKVVVTGPQTGGWAIPATTPIAVEIELVKGTNTIVFSGEGGGAQALNLDRIEIVKIGPKSSLSGKSVSVDAGAEEVRVPVTLNNGSALKLAEGTNGTLSALQFLVNYDATGLELVGFEPSEAFADFDWGTADYRTSGRVIGYGKAIADALDLSNSMEIGELVFKVTDGISVNVEIAVETACDNTATEYADFETSSFLVEVGGEASTDPIWLNIEDAIVLGSGETKFYTGRVGGMIMTINGKVTVKYDGETYSSKQGVLKLQIPESTDFFSTPVFEITNTGNAMAAYPVTFTYPAGHMMNPAKLAGGNTKISLAEGDMDGYYYSWTAEEDGHLTVTAKDFDPDKFDIKLTKPLTSEQKSIAWDGTNGAVTMDVSAGDEVIVEVANTDWNLPAVDVEFNTAFKKCHIKDFSDIYDLTKWYHGALDYVVGAEIMVGNDNKLMPEENISRAEIVQLIYTMAGKPGYSADTPSRFPDVTPTDWYYDAVMWATENNIAYGYGNGTFGPNDEINREQLVSFFHRYAGSPEAESTKLGFADAGDVSVWSLPAVLWASETGIVSGRDNNMFAPGGTSMRAEAAQIIMKYCELFGAE